MNNLIRTYGARLIGSLIAALAAWLLTRYGIEINADDQTKITTDVIGAMIGLYGFIYPIIHRTVSKETNPGDAASSHLANKEAREADLMKIIR